MFGTGRDRSPGPADVLRVESAGSVTLGSPELRSVLLVRLRVGLGDLLCSGPAVRALRAMRPDVHLALATWPEMAEVVARATPEIDELVAFPGVDGIPERPADGSYPAWVAAQRERGWDLALSLYGDNPQALSVTQATGARSTAGFWPSASGPPPGASWLPYPHRLHEVDRHLAALERLGLPAGAPRTLSFVLAPDERQRASDLLGRAGLHPRRFAVLHPGATSASRRWPAERFAAVADGLAEQGWQVAVAGVDAEAGVTGAVVRASRAPVVDLTGATSLAGYAAVLAEAAVVVSNDTGTAHLAAAVGAPCVPIFLSGDPVRWAHPDQAVVRAAVGCNPCPHLSCPIDFRCARRIAPSQVLAAALRTARRPPMPRAPSALP